MKKKSKNQVYIPHQDKWNEHFPTPGKPNPNYYTDSGAILLHRLRCNLQQAPTYPKQIKTEKEMKTLLLIPVILYTWLSLTYRDKIYHQIPNPTNQQKYIYLILQCLQIILLILLETVILRYT